MVARTILLVEDNPSDVNLTKRAFQKAKIANELAVVRDGEQALDYLFNTGEYSGRDRSIKPVVILLDLKLPKIDGISVLKRIKTDELTRRIPVVILTTSNEETDLSTCYKLGANSFIRKPVDFAQFAETISRLGIYWLILNEPPPNGKLL